MKKLTTIFLLLAAFAITSCVADHRINEVEDGVYYVDIAPHQANELRALEVTIYEEKLCPLGFIILEKRKIRDVCPTSKTTIGFKCEFPQFKIKCD